MAEPIGALRVDLSANAAQFEKDMGRARRAVGQSTTAMGKSLDGFRKNVGFATQGLFSLRSAIAGLGIGIALREIVRTSAEFQRLQTSLKTVTGSAEAATAAFAQIKDFAATTPFSLQEVTQGFIKLKALGLDPSAAALESYGNTASAMGKSLNDFVEAVADAITGEFERLKEFGIRSATEGDRVKFTFQGLTTEVGKNATEIEAYLRRIGQVQFAGAMDEQSKTLGGALSNLGDSFSVLQNEIGEGGLADAVEDVARRISDLTNGSKNLGRELGVNLGDAVRGVASAMEFAAENIRILTAGIAAFVAYRAAAIFGSIAASVAILAIQLHTASLAMGGLNVAIRANPIGALATVISAAVAALVLFYDKTVQIGDVTISVGKTVDAVWTTVSQTIVGLVKSTLFLVSSLQSLLTLDFEGFADRWMSSGRALTESFDKIVASWSDLKPTVKAIKPASDAAAVAVAKTGEAAAVSADKINDLRSALQFEIDQLGRTKAEQELYNLAKQKGVEVNDQFRASILPMIKQMQFLEQMHKAIEKAAESETKKREDLASRGVQLTKELRNEQEIYNDSVTELNTLYAAGELSANAYTRGLEKAKKTLDDTSEATKKNKEFARDLGLTFTSAFEDAVVGGGKLSDVLRGIEQDLLRLATRKLVTEPLLGALSSAFSGFSFGNLFSGFGGGGVNHSATGPGQLNAMFADGGMHTGGFRMVGERGPEIEATGPARYYSAGRSADLLRGDGGPGGNVAVNVYAPPGSNVETRESTGPGGRSIDVIIDETVARNIGTPGSRTGRALRQSFGANRQLIPRG